ncbi:MAG TPA: hypothetical protein VFZ00_06360 [Solirubrobacter sp.]|nr:hypothetical protein [Solirubrobacter sp.]
MGCGSETDTAHLDTRDGHTGCENRPNVGRLRLAARAIEAKAGEVAQLRLGWRHPKAWRSLRSITLRVTRDERFVGAVTIRPRSNRIAARGALELVRQRTRLSHRGKTVSARIALRFDEALAGAKLTADVIAVDARGARQVERGAGTIRVSA